MGREPPHAALDESRPMPPSRGLLFHPDLLYGTQLARRINDYTFFDYDQREALHLSEREQHMVVELFDRIEEELQHPIDRHSQTLITDAIGLLLDYCMRYYDRQFISTPSTATRRRSSPMPSACCSTTACATTTASSSRATR